MLKKKPHHKTPHWIELIRGFSNVKTTFFFVPVWHFADVTMFFCYAGERPFLIPMATWHCRWCWRGTGRPKSSKTLFFGSENRNVLVDRQIKDELCIFLSLWWLNSEKKQWPWTGKPYTIVKTVDWSWYRDIDLSNWKTCLLSVVHGVKSYMYSHNMEIIRDDVDPHSPNRIS